MCRPGLFSKWILTALLGCAVFALSPVKTLAQNGDVDEGFGVLDALTTVPPPARPVVAIGTVKTISQTAIVIRQSSGRETTFQLPPKARIVQTDDDSRSLESDHKISLTEISVGDQVQVFFKKPSSATGTPTANRIRLTWQVSTQGQPPVLCRSNGVVKTISGTAITLSLKKGGEETFQITNKARIMEGRPCCEIPRNIRKIRLADIAVGDSVFIGFKKFANAAGVPTALAIMLVK